MEIKKVEVMSMAKILGITNAVVGLIIGVIISFLSLFGAALGGGSNGILFGLGSIIIVPLLYGVMGYLSGIFSALLYNFIAERFGGIKLVTK